MGNNKKKKTNKTNKEKKHEQDHPTEPQQPPPDPLEFNVTADDISVLPLVLDMTVLGAVEPPAKVIEALYDEYVERHRLNHWIKYNLKSPSELKIQREKEEWSREAATKVVASHYRRASIKVHPDRHGERYQEDFKRLRLANEVLGDETTRTDYVDKMTDLWIRLWVSNKGVRNQQVHSNLLQRSHETWIETYHKEKAERESDRYRYDKAADRKAGFYLEGDLLHQQPRKPGLESASGTLVTLLLTALHPWHSFAHSCKCITICDEGEYTKTDQKLKEIQGSELENLFTSDRFQNTHRMSVNVTVPEPGVYSFYWFATLVQETSVGSIRRLTEHSESLTVDLTPKHIKKLYRQLPAIYYEAQQVTNELHSYLARCAKKPLTRADEKEKRYWDMHRVISSATGMRRRLGTVLETLAKDSVRDPTLLSLREAIDVASKEKFELYDAVMLNQKKESLKSFKQSIATLLESGEASTWIESVTKEELDSTGGEINRLYQLLVEGKKANSLLVDVETLAKAGQRDDLFTAKQCETLTARASAVEAEFQAQTEEILKEQERRQEAEKIRRELEERAKGMPPLRALVKIHSLAKNQELNGAIGRYMGLAEKRDRYVVRLVDNDRDLALKKDNFMPYYGALPAKQHLHKEQTSDATPWSCSRCTYHHEGIHAAASRCIQCDAERGPAPGSFAAVGIDKKATTSGPSPTTVTTTPSLPSSKPVLPTVAPAAPPTRMQQPISRPEAKSSPSRTNYAAKGNGRTKFIRVADRGIFVGMKGAHINQLCDSSGARVHLDHHGVVDGIQPVIITGAPECVEAAASLIDTFNRSRGFAPPACSPPPSPKHQKVPQNAPSSRVAQSAHVFPPPAKATPISPPPKWPPPPQAKPRDSPPRPVLASRHALQPQSMPSSRDASLRTGHVPPHSKAAPPQPAIQRPVAVASQPAAATNTVMDSLLLFLLQHQDCLKCPAQQFCTWLQSQDVSTVGDLDDAINDSDFSKDMQAKGLKGFKRAALKNAVRKAAKELSMSAEHVPVVDNGLGGPQGETQLSESLMCPITHVLMVKDPVIASDGFTYERDALMSWILHQRALGATAIRSPMKDDHILQGLDELRANMAVLSMARAYAQSYPDAV